MTIFLPLEPDLPFPQSPSFLSAVSDPTQHVAKVVKAVLKAKRIAVVCGAGISVEAGIPDFRSSDGLFQSIKRENPKEALSSGRDLFDASVFNSEHTTALFCQMIARLSDLSTSASPTYFHKLLRALDDRGKLLRVYTQNIDALELKAGLTFGVPGYDDRRSKSKTRSPKGKERADAEIDESSQMQDESSPSSSRLPTPPAETPRCIPLHGTLQTMHCQTCTHTFPLSSHTESLSSGIPPDCPECTSLEATRQLIGKRRRGVGKLRPSVVLYNEAHRDGEGVGEVARRDLVGAKGKGRAGADLLLVVGTSLRVPGTKRIVREFAKAVRARAAPPASKDTTSKPPTPTPSPRRSPSADDDAPAPIKTIYLNLDFPVPTREWDGVFDVWVQGDAQAFAGLVHAEMEREEQAKVAAMEKRRRREEEEARREPEKERMAQEVKTPTKGKGKGKSGTGTKRKAPKTAAVEASAKRPTKKRKVTLIVRPPSLPSSSPSSPKTPTRRSSTARNNKRVAPEDVDTPAIPLPHTPRPTPPMPMRRLTIPEVLITVPPPSPTKSSHKFGDVGGYRDSNLSLCALAVACAEAAPLPLPPPLEEPMTQTPVNEFVANPLTPPHSQRRTRSSSLKSSESCLPESPTRNRARKRVPPTALPHPAVVDYPPFQGVVADVVGLGAQHAGFDVYSDNAASKQYEDKSEDANFDFSHVRTLQYDFRSGTMEVGEEV